MAISDTLKSRYARLLRQVGATADALKQAQAQTSQALAALGIRPPGADAKNEGPVVDVAPERGVVAGAIYGLARRTTQGLLFVTAVALLAAALWSLGMFVAATLLAFMVVTRGLGLHIDMRPQAA